MPTGYTHFIENGKVTTGKDFIFLCARAFGACIDMRDESLDKPIPKEFKENTDFYNNELNKSIKELNRINSMSDKDIQDVIDKEYIEDQKYYKNKIKENKNQYENHLRILKEIQNIEFSNSEYNNLKKFAMDQIDMVLIEYRSDFYEKELGKPKETIDYWKHTKIKLLEDNIRTYKKDIESEHNRVKNNNKWINNLRKILFKKEN